MSLAGGDTAMSSSRALSLPSVVCSTGLLIPHQGKEENFPFWDPQGWGWSLQQDTVPRQGAVQEQPGMGMGWSFTLQLKNGQ